jgi:GNAT superfamily N-acetyltransferase
VGDDPKVRTVTRWDQEAVRALLEHLNDLQEDWRVFPPRPGFLEEVLEGYRRQAAAGDAVHLVAEVGGRIVGTAFAREHVVSRFADARALEVSSVVVHPAHRRRGIARALLRAIGEEARRRGVGHLDLATFVQNEGALGVWESGGFEPRYVQMVAEVPALLDRLDAE